MLVFVTASRANTVRDLVGRKIGWDIPNCVSTTYDALFRSSRTSRAVHILTDFERLSDRELLLAAELYRSLREAGIRCLNDPARVMTRYQLLIALQEAGINPFGVYRADGRPRPQRFPVFVRFESDHEGPLSNLLETQEELDRCLAAARDGGRPLRGLIVTEFAAEPIAPGVWRKFGTFRIASNHSVHHTLLSDGWAIKDMSPNVVSDAFIEEERRVVTENILVDAVARAFEIAGIEWGRADHALFHGRHVVYEINTNPMVHFGAQGFERRTETKKISSKRMAQFLWEIDDGDGAPIKFAPVGPRRDQKRPWRLISWRKLRRMLSRS
jgi:hypothetical protein